MNEVVRLLTMILSKSLTNTKPLVITDTNPNTNINGMAIYAITNTTFTTLDAVYEGDSLITQTLEKGHIWYLPIKGTVTLASGSVIVYQHDSSGN